jgi:hypothetical protein
VIDISEYLENIPALHTWDGGVTWNSGGYDAWHLRSIYDLVMSRFPDGGAHIGETGAGNSTILFRMTRPAMSWAIAPEGPLRDRIVSFCQTHDIGLDGFAYYEDFSETQLPKLALPDDRVELDVALIDGGHGMPTVFNDLVYLNILLKEGGLLLVDDINLHSVREAVKMLNMQPGWTLIANLQKTLVFRKDNAEKRFPEFNQMPYIMAHHAADDFIPKG